MQDRQLYEQILGLQSPWHVAEVKLCLDRNEVKVYLKHAPDATWSCAECGRECPVHDHHGPRTWRHLDTCQLQTTVIATVPRTRCPEHGVRLAQIPWAEPYGRFTLLFERMVLAWLQDASQSAVASRLNLSWDEVHGIMQRAVERGLKRRQVADVRHVGIDEKSFRRGHRYATLVNDLDTGHVLYVGEDRRETSLDGFWAMLTDEQLEAMEGVAIDMSAPYENAIRAHVPESQDKIVYDKFHVVMHLSEAVDKVRRQENKQLRAAGDERLVGTKYDWLRNPDNFEQDDWQAFQQLRHSALKTARAWAIKEQVMVLWDYTYEKSATNFFDRWYNWAIRSRLEPVKKVARMMKKRLPNILTYLKHRITNAMSEGINSKIQWIKYTARGFRNFENFRTAIYFHCGGLDLSHAH